MSDPEGNTQDRGRRRADATDDEPAGRAGAEPSCPPLPEHLDGPPRTRRHSGGGQAVADVPPGIPGGYGTTAGGRPGAAGHARPPLPEVPPEPPVRSDRDTGEAAVEPGDDDRPVGRPDA
ncbi:hypothetical protein SAMN05216532_0974 [Streptomyces sp. 2231.1]|uniref:hypothetical protein n=1 Tax=Streptomyces sp. 2231.1 TaxID=1855347 RepID=UPI00089903CA|nr:hypothetical protein [Streptomyces sp. 2231.1]SEC28537.1 hypothetical protein SAMN05216532_0974 [Streptomyces sp. 2231.1]